jgi:hypothetical protein
MGRTRGTTWQGKIILSKVHRWVRTSKERRTPVRTGPELPGGHAGSPEQAPGSPSKVRVLARSQDEKDPGMGKGPVPARVQALLYSFRSSEGPLLLRGVWPVT